MNLFAFRFGVVTLLFVGISGCEFGQGVNSTVVPSTAHFPLQSAFKALVANGFTKNITVSGSCSGTGNSVSAPATTAATFEGVEGLSAVGIVITSFTNCTPASTSTTITNYYDSNYTPLGFYSVGSNYGIYQTPPTMPTSVTVGSSGGIGTATLYTNSTKTAGNGTQVMTYAVEADTESSAIVNLISTTYNNEGTLALTEKDRYRIKATGALIPVSSDIQYANASTLHLIFTYN